MHGILQRILNPLSTRPKREAGKRPTIDRVGARYAVRFDEYTRSGSRRGAEAIVPSLTQLVQPKSVVDVGCGTGEWLAVFEECGVSDVLGIDGEWIEQAGLVIPLTKFVAVDLTHCFEAGRTFDLAVCTEVAEHLPTAHSDSFIQLLTTLAPVVLFSAAMPGQSRQNHINCQWPYYWFQMFGRRGFLAYDVIRKLVWRNPLVPPWYQQNCFLFVKQSHPLVTGALANEVPFRPWNDLTLVPASQAWSEPTLRALPSIVGHTLARSFSHWLGGGVRAASGHARQRRAATHTRGSTTPGLSVVVCTRNRGARLGACLDRISELRSNDSWELVLVDNGSSDDTPEILKRYQAEATFPVVLVQEARTGLALARNAGVAASHGEIIAFTDDDCYPDPDWLSNVRRAFTDRRIGYMGGRVLLYDSADAPTTINTNEYAEWIPPHSLLRGGFIQGANMAVRKEVFDDTGGFDPLFGSGTPLLVEDIELLARASAAGWCGLYHPDAVVYHHHGRSLADVDGLLRLYLQGGGAYSTKMLLRRGTRMLGARHWVASFRRHDLLTLAWECYGAALYVMKRISLALQGGSTSS